MFVRLVCVTAAIAISTTASAQTPPASGGVEQLDFDRPEAWALKYFIANTTLTGLDVTETPRAGSVSIGLETGWIPALTEAQQRVGFNGTAPQDLNAAPVMLRPQVAVGLPARIVLTVAGVPPVRAFGVTPRLLAAAVEWTAVEAPAWRLAFRGHGQTGTVTGAFTCPAAVAAQFPGSPGNPTGCTSESADVATLRYAGAEAHVALRMLRMGALTPHVSMGLNVVDASYQLNAVAFGRLDRSRLDASGIMPSTSAGISAALGDRVALAVDAYYAPLAVRRSAAAGRTFDSLVTGRALIVYKVKR